MLLNHLEQMFEEICRTLISILVSSDKDSSSAQLVDAMQEGRAVKNSGSLAAEWTLAHGHTGPASAGMQTHHPDTEQRHLPCPTQGTGKAQQHLLKHMLENLLREVLDKTSLRLYLKTACTITASRIFLFFCGPAN